VAEIKQVLVPDIGNFKGVEVIEVAVKPGDTVAAEQTLISLETDKATMEVPTPFAGVVKEVKIKVGDKVSEGALIVILESADSSAPGNGGDKQPLPKPAPAAAQSVAPAQSKPVAAVPVSATSVQPASASPHPTAHASPSIRHFARELGVSLLKVTGSGAKGRITKDDVQNFVKQSLAQPAGGSGLPGLLPWPDIDFAKFGAIETKPLSRIKKISGANLHRNWVSIPHVTQFEDADISELEAFRKELGADYAKQNIKISALAFILKAVAISLKQFPDFNASLDAGGENLVLKKYIHIGVAVDTPEGLVVPVIRDVDQKGIVQLAKELGEVSVRAREKKVSAAEMQGGCFTISSLGGIGGTAFTPIINAPEVAILGVSRSSMKPVWKDGEFVPRLMLPLSLSYDHRVIDGAAGARFITHLARVLSDIRRLAL
jgi:pyruvate dehydrogenase E2 component (dihydrolipoamide acetyltransferase)